MLACHIIFNPMIPATASYDIPQQPKLCVIMLQFLANSSNNDIKQKIFFSFFDSFAEKEKNEFCFTEVNVPSIVPIVTKVTEKFLFVDSLSNVKELR